jgi:DNA-binding transcriptional MerR regulator
MTLKEASETTGVPTSTIRKWARNENIPSFMEDTGDNYLRMVSMSGIRQWAEELGREIRPEPDPVSAQADVDVPTDPVQDTEEPVVPEGSMLVPLDAWNRVLNQLGNLHEAGQQLAEARERAAKAETEAYFLKERLADLRKELDETRHSPPQPATESTGEQRAQAQRSPTSLARSIYRSWRQGRRS